MPYRGRAPAPRVPSSPRRAILASWVAGSLALAACTGGGSVTPSVQPSSAPSDAPSSEAATPTGTPDPTGPPTVALAELENIELDLAGGPDWPALLDGSVWILAPDGPLLGGGVEPFVYRLNAQTGEEQARIPIGGRLCQGIAAGFGSLWACTDAGLARIDPATNEVVAEVPFQTAQVFLRPVLTDDRVWMLAGNVVGNQVVEIDPATNEVVATHPLGYVAAGLAAGDGALWATAPADGLVLRLDPASGNVTVHADRLPAATTIAFGAGSLWVGLYGEHGGEVAAAGAPTIARVSPADGSIEAEIAIGTTTMVESDIWASDEEVWVRSPADPFLVKINPATSTVVYAIGGFHSGGTLTVDGGVVWATSVEFATAWRIEP